MEEAKKIFVRADLPAVKDDRKALVTNGLEAGIVSYILRDEDPEFRKLGKMEDAVMTKDGRSVDPAWEIARIDSPEDQEKVLALAGSKKGVIVETGDWSVIPLENMIARFRGSGTKIYAVAKTKEDAELYLKTMENGTDGIVLDIKDPMEIAGFRDLVGTPAPVELSEVTVEDVKPIEMGDRVCVDTCSLMHPGEGMLVGSYSNCLFLVQSESEDNGYVATRPFRVNAGAVHEYCMVPGGGTRYLSEISAGDPVLIVGRGGNARVGSVGRCKVEVRPLLIVSATDGSRTFNVILQNAETIKLVTPGGAVPVTELKKGDRVLAHVETGGRHFGMKVEETITEK